MAYVEVEVDLGAFDEEDLITEVRSMGYIVTKDPEIADDIDVRILAEAKKYNPSQFEELFREYVWNRIGVVV